MCDKYKIHKGDDPYFVTFTNVDWTKILENDSYKQIIVDNIQFYRKNKGLVVFGYCIKPDHMHMIIGANEIYSVSEILRD